MVIQNWVHHPVSQLLNSLPLQSGPTKQAVIVPRLDHEFGNRNKKKNKDKDGCQEGRSQVA